MNDTDIVLFTETNTSFEEFFGKVKNQHASFYSDFSILLPCLFYINQSRLTANP